MPLECKIPTIRAASTIHVMLNYSIKQPTLISFEDLSKLKAINAQDQLNDIPNSTNHECPFQDKM